MARGFVLALLVVGCVSPGPGNGAPQAPAPAPEQDPLGAPQDGACELELRTSVSSSSDSEVTLIVFARNATGQRLTGLLSAPCPRGPLFFEGLPAGYDVGAQCAAGACPPGASAGMSLELAPEEIRVLGQVVLHTAGDSCNAALPAGSYRVHGLVAAEGMRVCSRDAAPVSVQAAPRPAVPQRTPEPHAPPSPQPAQPDPKPSVPLTIPERPAPKPSAPAAPTPERCPAMGCMYKPCPPGVAPPTGCAAVCGCGA